MSTEVRLMTAEDLERLPNDHMRHELVRGELRTMPLAVSEHGILVIRLSIPLAMHVNANQLGRVFAPGTGFRITADPDTVRAPDVAFVRKERTPPTGIPKSYWPGAPDLAVEIVSPKDTYEEVEEKVQEWLDAGTSVVWVVSPKRRTVTVHRSAKDVVPLTEKDELDGGTLLPGFRCRVSEIVV
jgi:Uma2 family endonuclease